MPRPAPSPNAADPAEPSFTTRLASGHVVQIERIGPGSAAPSGGDSTLRELRGLIAGLLALRPLAAEAHGINLPTAWAARAEDGTDLGIAWWTPLPWHPPTAIAEVAVAGDRATAGLARVLLDLLVLSATGRGVEWLQVRAPAGDQELARAAAALRGRPLREDEARFEIPLGPGHRRYHRSGIHRRVPRAIPPAARAAAPGDSQ